MDAYIKRIYDMLYSPVLTPYNLLENVKLYYYDNSVEELIFDRQFAIEEAKENYYINAGTDSVAG